MDLADLPDVDPLEALADQLPLLMETRADRVRRALAGPVLVAQGTVKNLANRLRK